jgi:hypothetical protein
MDNNSVDQNITNTLLGSSEVSSLNLSDSNNGGISSFFTNLYDISLTTWLIIILILSFLGFNIFVYLAKGTQDITNFFKPILDKITIIIGNITGQVVDVSAEGAKAVVGTTANVINQGLTDVQQLTPQGIQSTTSIKGDNVKNVIQQQDIAQNNSLNRALNTSVTYKNENEYEADEASSSIQNGVPKSGWCYIGEDRHFRTCAQVGVNDTCISGEIFPSQEICINPNLRS